MTREDALDALRVRRDLIDQVDQRILRLLNERAVVAEEIGKIKQSAALPIYEPKREDQVFANVMEHNDGPLTNEAVKRVFERIIDEMRKVQSDRMTAQAVRMDADKKQC